MATKKDSGDSVKLTHTNGATVSVSAEKAERLATNVLFNRPSGSKAAAKSATTDS